MNKTTRTSQATSNTSNSNFNEDIPKWSQESSTEEKDIGIRKCRRKINVEIKNDEMKGNGSEVEEIKILKCSRKCHVETVNKEMRGSRVQRKLKTQTEKKIP